MWIGWRCQYPLWLQRVQGHGCCLYLVRFKNKSADEDKWLPKSIKDVDTLLHRFRSQKRNHEGRVRAFLFWVGECQPPTSQDSAGSEHQEAKCLITENQTASKRVAEEGAQDDTT
ncbi:uncharacterized protein VP01_1224g8 [Puccinia sorghi]|uniref:Chromo domain-containing protein n=1 Tax=Puccinia sorghi TaxID=27349 RepID=A0A0L6VPY6_9BASI|nr:uncharacterized protein VP01_1224g8 [Puccinia sorghi]